MPQLISKINDDFEIKFCDTLIQWMRVFLELWSIRFSSEVERSNPTLLE